MRMSQVSHSTSAWRPLLAHRHHRQLTCWVVRCRIIHAMREYRGDAEWEVARWEHNFARLSPRHRCHPRLAALSLHIAYKKRTITQACMDSGTAQ